MEYCGIDVHQKTSDICILDESGEVVERSRIATGHSSLARFFGARARMKVVMEAGGSSPWVSRAVEKEGHEVAVCMPRHVRLIAESTMKSDEIDAEVLARLVRIDSEFLGRVTHRREETQILRGSLTARAALVKARASWICTVRGMLRGFGYRIAGGHARTFAARCAKTMMSAELREMIQPLVHQIELVTIEIKDLEEKLEGIAAELPVVQHLQEIPGVGLIVALHFVLSIEDPGRFRRSRDVGSFFGLRPVMRGSGEVQYYGRITRQGDSEMRRLLVQAAHGMMRTRKTCRLKQWATKLEKRRGKGKAIVALARKIAVLMHHLWATGEVFEAFPGQGPA